MENTFYRITMWFSSVCVSIAYTGQRLEQLFRIPVHLWKTGHMFFAHLCCLYIAKSSCMQCRSPQMRSQRDQHLFPSAKHSLAAFNKRYLSFLESSEYTSPYQFSIFFSTVYAWKELDTISKKMVT